MDDEEEGDGDLSAADLSLELEGEICSLAILEEEVESFSN
jgi:hypothetical protein